jgi:hypothetical protein
MTMKVSFTIPQMFYDLIARVIPGFLFFTLLSLEFIDTESGIISAEKLPDNAIIAILITIAVFIMSYLMGWVLLAVTFFSTEPKIKKEHESKSGNLVSITEMYHKIRIKNEAVGFRVLKLRAEARMIESSRTGMFLVFVFTVCLLLLNKLYVITTYSHTTLEWVIKLSIPLFLALAFMKIERRTWNNYYGNIVKHYKILFKTSAVKPKK